MSVVIAQPGNAVRSFSQRTKYSSGMYLRFIATKEVCRISTDGRTTFFDPDWFQKLDKEETDYILSHEVLHIVLEDTRRPAFFSGERFHHACDIIACSVLRDRGWDTEELPHIGKLPHRTYFPRHEGNALEPLEAYREVPFDPGAMPPAQRRRFLIDSDAFWGGRTLPETGTLILFPGYDELLPRSRELVAALGLRPAELPPASEGALE